ncbi:Hint domain-containing protein [Asaia sp. BMEF1]|uniref:Hint domain-containing protein n=1 Tax=Asaia sp. BMEF1 TaxID=3155932 RepID=UPI003F68109B
MLLNDQMLRSQLGRDIIQFTNLFSTPTAYQIATSGKSQTIKVTDRSGNTIASISVAGTNFTAGKYSSSGRGPLTISKTGTTLSIEALVSVCFLAGSMIRTPDGDRRVETLKSGDSVGVNANGKLAVRKIIWAGNRRKIINTGRPDDESVYPVRIKKHALGSGKAYQDLLITSEHCIIVAGKFVPVRMLVNGRKIVYDRTLTDYRYYHLETAEHAVIYANGAETESYLDTGNRIAFTAASEATPITAPPFAWTVRLSSQFLWRARRVPPQQYPSLMTKRPLRRQISTLDWLPKTRQCYCLYAFCQAALSSLYPPISKP